MHYAEWAGSGNLAGVGSDVLEKLLRGRSRSTAAVYSSEELYVVLMGTPVEPTTEP